MKLGADSLTLPTDPFQLEQLFLRTVQPLEQSQRWIRQRNSLKRHRRSLSKRVQNNSGSVDSGDGDRSSSSDSGDGDRGDSVVVIVVMATEVTV